MIFKENALQGRHILVTGASSGIGRAAAIAMAACGARLCLSARDATRLEETLQALAGSGHYCVPAEMDGSDQIVELVQKTAQLHGPFNGMFHAAGISMLRPAKLSKEKQFDEIYASSVKSAMALARAASLRGVMEDGSAIVMMSSVAATRGQTGMALYSSAKAAIEGLVRSLAVEFAPRRIRVNAIAAGAVETAMHAQLTHTLGEQSLSAYEHKHLLGFGTVDDIASAVIYLMAESGRWMTGTSLSVDGGYSVR